MIRSRLGATEPRRRERRGAIGGRYGPRRRLFADPAGFGLIEVMIALTIFAIGMLAVARLSLSVGAQTNWATWQTDQSLAAQQVLERIQRGGYDAAAWGTDTITVGNRMYVAQRTVTNLTPRVKEVSVTINPTRADSYGSPPRTFVSRLYKTRPLPSAP